MKLLSKSKSNKQKPLTIEMVERSSAVEEVPLDELTRNQKLALKEAIEDAIDGGRLG